jgi:hypothetical protein
MVGMNPQKRRSATERTAMLVVHGMGKQRPLETVRGIVDAVWSTNGEEAVSPNKIWIVPERLGIDIDLSVITTSNVPGTNRRVDFHELYWSHLMSETRTIAVLLWLFELARKGPSFKNMNELWWSVAIFLELIIFSVTLLTLLIIERVAEINDSPQSIVVAPVIMFFYFSSEALFGLLGNENYALFAAQEGTQWCC